MKFSLLRHTEGCKRLILIYSGWSTDVDFYRHIKRVGWDVGVVTDYSDMNLDCSFLDDYSTVWVFAWSLGVKAASVSLPVERISAAFAINGTLHPYSDTLGIPTAIYDGTMDGLNPRNLMKFQMRMVGDRSKYNDLFANVDYNDKIDVLRGELKVIRDCRFEVSKLPWRKAFISEDDRIFPYSNMKDSWVNEGVECSTIKGAHYIDLQQVVSWVVPDVECLADRFSKASDSYLNNAAAQKKIAERLTDLIPESNSEGEPFLKVLELGCGKGLFTRLYAPKIGMKSATYVDIVPLDRFCLAQDERYVERDAEVFLNECDEKFDMILSSSTVQWFSDFERFLDNSSRLLNNDGMLCFSTFAKGNLYELDAVRVSPLCYPSVQEVEAKVRKRFSNCKVIEEEIILNFENARDLMMHLKLTGVGGYASSEGVTPFRLRNIRTLTFRPVYVIVTL